MKYTNGTIFLKKTRRTTYLEVVESTEVMISCLYVLAGLEKIGWIFWPLRPKPQDTLTGACFDRRVYTYSLGKVTYSGETCDDHV